MLNSSSRLVLALVVSTLACSAIAPVFAATPEFNDLTAAATKPMLPSDAAAAHPFAPVGRGNSAGIAPTLPTPPDTTIPGTQMPFYLINVGLLDLQHSPDTGCVSVDDPTCDAPR